MNSSRAFAFAIAMAGLAPAHTASAAAAPACAVVELFTYEGCSSCPPTEALVTHLDLDARSRGRRVFHLESHFDYWDGLGWRDPYSSAAASARQRGYAGLLGLE